MWKLVPRTVEILKVNLEIVSLGVEGQYKMQNFTDVGGFLQQSTVCIR